MIWGTPKAVLRLIFSVLALMLAACPVVARDTNVQSQSRAKSEKSAPVPRSESVPPKVPVVPMEEFAAEPSASGDTSDASIQPSACMTRISNRIAVVEALPTFGGPGDCGATDVVRLEAVIQPDKSRVAITPPATVRCTMAEAIANWVREDLTPATAGLGGAPKAIDNYASYDCRGRNRLLGARISEHGLANAIDIRGVNLSNGKFADFTDRNLARDFRETMRKQVCARFTTVLGPGSDGHHEKHIHVDLAQRRGGYRLCQWAVYDPLDAIPLPRPRPAEAP